MTASRLESTAVPKHIGIVGCSAPGAALCYQTICTEAGSVLGGDRHPEVTMHTHSLGDYMTAIERGDWDGVAELMLSSSRKLAAVGAEFAICPDNTIHQSFDRVSERSPIPWLHIADAVAEEAERQGYRRLGITGTRYLMEGPVYPSVLERHGLGWEIPEADERDKINEIIFAELVKARFEERSRQYLNQVARTLAEKGCDAMVLGCTELPLLVDPDDCPLPALDSTRLLARSAIRRAVPSALR